MEEFLRLIRRGLTLMVVVAALGVSAGPAEAATPQPANGVLVVTSAVFTSQRAADGNLISTLEIQRLVFGTIQGTMTSEATTIVHQDGSVNYKQFDTCVCIVDGRAGIAYFRSEGNGPSMPGSAGHAETIRNGQGGLEGFHTDLGLVSFPVTFYSGTYHFDS
jgi:hypothetical protein